MGGDPLGIINVWKYWSVINVRFQSPFWSSKWEKRDEEGIKVLFPVLNNIFSIIIIIIHGAGG